MTPSFYCIFIDWRRLLYSYEYYECTEATFYQIRNNIANYAEDNFYYVAFVRDERLLEQSLKNLKSQKLTYCYNIEYDQKNIN
jgi:hypothetical protein